MTQPVQEPTQGRLDAAQGYGTRQLFRRPATGSGGGGGGTVQVPVYLDTPDASGNGFVQFSGNLGWTPANSGRHLFNAFAHGLDGTWEGVIRVPQNYGSTPELVVSWVANVTSGAIRNGVATFAVSDGDSYDGTYIFETFVNTTVPGTANVRKDVTFSLSSAPAAGDDLFVMVVRNGGSGGDTVTVDVAVVKVVFQYVSA